MKIILKNKPYVKEAFANRNDMTNILVMGLSTYLFWPALCFKIFSNISNLIILAIMVTLGTLYFISNIVVWRRLMYSKVLSQDKAVYIAVSEIGEGLFLHQLFKKEFNFIKQLYREHIFLISKNEFQNFHKGLKNVISLECYMAFFVKENEIQENHLENAVFNIAYCADNFAYSEKLDKTFYEIIIEESSIKEAVQQIIPYCNKVSYKKNLEEKLQNTQIIKKEKNNLLVSNYIEMDRNLQNEVDAFQSFKTLLNMLELLNYLYTIILVSYQEWSVSTLLHQQCDKLTNATFGSWIKLRIFLSGKNQFKQISNSDSYDRCKCFKSMMESEMCDYELFTQLYRLMHMENLIPNKEDNKIKLSYSFEIMRIFRNNTRGHGVYTFEITDELNLSLVEIIKCWYQKLNKYGFLEEDYINLEQLGWILKYKDKTYYFYSYNRETNLLDYHCFFDGTVISMPHDFVG